MYKTPVLPVWEKVLESVLLRCCLLLFPQSVSSGGPGAQGGMGPGGTSLEFDVPGRIQRSHSKGHSRQKSVCLAGPGHRGWHCILKAQVKFFAHHYLSIVSGLAHESSINSKIKSIEGSSEIPWQAQVESSGFKRNHLKDFNFMCASIYLHVLYVKRIILKFNIQIQHL